MEFELNKPDYFEFEAVELIENFEPDDFGNRWYNAKVSGNAESLMWLAKTKPETNKKYYGHVEKTKSGQRLRFRTDKLPENAPAKSYQKSPEQEESIARAVALKAAVEVFVGTVTDKMKGGFEPSYVLRTADTFLSWLKNEKPSTEPEKAPEDKPDKIIADDGDTINLADIPF